VTFVSPHAPKVTGTMQKRYHLGLVKNALPKKKDYKQPTFSIVDCHSVQN
jgi:hypothetical protein